MTVWTLDATLAAFLLASFIHDRFAWLNARADEFEDWAFTGWLHYNDLGDPATWVQHTITASLIALGGGALSFGFLGDFGVGFAHFAVVALGFYVVREANQAWFAFRRRGMRDAFVDHRRHPAFRHGYHAGWLVDGVMDVVGPFVVVWIGLG